MGAKSSLPPKPKNKTGESKLAIVNANGEDEPATLDIYNTKQFKLERSFPLPLPEKYIWTTCHPTRPVIFVCGESEELSGEGTAIWRVDLRTEPGLELLSHLPSNFHGEEFHMAVCCHDEHDNLYVLGVDRECMRLNFHTKEWEDIPPFPCKLAEIRQVFSTSYLVGIVTTSGAMLCYQETKPEEPSPEEWECRAEPGTIPDGNTVVIFDDMFVYSVKESTLTKCDVRTGKIADVEHKLDTGALQKNWFISGTECFVYFVGKHYSDEKTTVMEVYLESGKPMEGVVAGYLREGTETKAIHAIFVEAPPKEKKKK